MDAPVAPGGLAVEWSSQPGSWPGTLGAGFTLERAILNFDSLRVVGDAGPGDPRTTATGFEVRWEGETSPAAIMFGEAPSGRYSQVSVLLDALTDESYKLRGHVDVDGTDWEYLIEDDDPLTFTVQIDKTLTPPTLATVQLRINFQGALDVVDFSTLDVEDGKLNLEEGDDQIPAFRAALIAGFEIINNDAGRGGGGVP